MYIHVEKFFSTKKRFRSACSKNRATLLMILEPEVSTIHKKKETVSQSKRRIDFIIYIYVYSKWFNAKGSRSSRFDKEKRH